MIKRGPYIQWSISRIRRLLATTKAKEAHMKFNFTVYSYMGRAPSQHWHKPHDGSRVVPQIGGRPLSSGQIQVGARQLHIAGGKVVLLGGGGGDEVVLLGGGGGDEVVLLGGGGGEEDEVVVVVRDAEDEGVGDKVVVVDSSTVDELVVLDNGATDELVTAILESVGEEPPDVDMDAGDMDSNPQVHTPQAGSLAIPQIGGSPLSSGHIQVGPRHPHVPIPDDDPGPGKLIP